MTATLPAPAADTARRPATRRGGPRPRRPAVRWCPPACSAWWSAAATSRSAPCVDVLFRPDGTESSTIVHELRLPRTVLALVVGIALGIAGALMQGHTRNPLADPGLLGVRPAPPSPSSSASTSSASPTSPAMPGSRSPEPAWQPRPSSRSGRPGAAPTRSRSSSPAPRSPRCCSSLTQAIVLRDLDTLDAYRFWAVGSVNGRDLDVVWQVLPFIVVGLLLAAVSASTPQPAPARRRRRELARHAPDPAQGDRHRSA